MTKITELQTELEKLISFKSISKDKQANKQLLLYVQTELEKLGLQTVLSSINGHSSLIAGTQSLTSCKVLLQAHVDVVPAPDELFIPKVSDGKLIGRGAYDMLFATACFLVMLRKTPLKGLDIGVMLTSDEEFGGFDGVAKLAPSYNCEVCILPDAGGKDRLSTEAKGILELEITIDGKSGHAARPLEYDNPIVKLSPLIAGIQKLFPNNDPNETTCSISKVQAGDALNQVPDRALLYLDIRYAPNDDPHELQKKIQDLTLQHDAHVKQLTCEPCFSNDPTDPYIAAFVNLYESSTGRTITTMRAPGSSDARFFDDSTPVIMIRPDGGDMHGPAEWISLSSMEEFLTIITEYTTKFATIRKNNE